MYGFTQRCRELFELLGDDLSREVFKARMQFDLEPSMTNAIQILCLNEVSLRDPALMAQRKAWKSTVGELARAGKKLIIYGVGLAGQKYAELLQYENVDFYGFCDRRSDSFPDGLNGKPVLPQKHLFDHPDECYLIIAGGPTSYDSILHDLQENHFPMDHILRFLDYDRSLDEKQYFDFPTLYRRGTAFVDAGCFDCTTDILFEKWSGGVYSKIFAFEPDPSNFALCQIKGKGIRDLKLIQAGVADRPGTAEFIANGMATSSLSMPDREDMPTSQKVNVQITTIDEQVGDETVGMVKMDIEGAELAALHGAERTIRRDRPLLAISAYHRPGDTVALMDYLNKIVPEYRFWLRHYTGPVTFETVLYASVERP